MDIINELEHRLYAERNKENAQAMEKYMRNLFPFIGIKTPERNKLLSTFYQDTGLLKKPFDRSFVRTLWKKEEREFQYTALNYMTRKKKELQPEDLTLCHDLITEKSWWDTVDHIASHLVGTLAKRFLEEVLPTVDNWATDDNMWLRRTAIIYQLKYKGETDEQRLYGNILKNATNHEFFIQKAIGWALREYSKTNPDSVRAFIQQHPLPKLSVREGSKYV
jgi:3-methyladenine DNA glycosylase AlkD